jgi:hypothetical protein
MQFYNFLMAIFVLIINLFSMLKNSYSSLTKIFACGNYVSNNFDFLKLRCACPTYTPIPLHSYTPTEASQGAGFLTCFHTGLYKASYNS